MEESSVLTYIHVVGPTCEPQRVLRSDTDGLRWKKQRSHIFFGFMASHMRQNVQVTVLAQVRRSKERMRLPKRQIWLLRQGSIFFVRGSVTRINEPAQEPGYGKKSIRWPRKRARCVSQVTRYSTRIHLNSTTPR